MRVSSGKAGIQLEEFTMNRRTVFQRALGATALAATTGLAVHQMRGLGIPNRAPARSRVAVLKCATYERCLSVVRDGLRLLNPGVRGKRVLLKPNLVEYSPSAPINTHPLLIAAAAEAFAELGAASVKVGEGPGHIRDTELLLEETGLKAALRIIGGVEFIDLNFDSIRPVRPTSNATSLNELWLPESVLSADVVVSMPKIKTHHWAGVTLSLKNLFGTMPGSAYGWPKNVLHWEGIENSIVELASSIPISMVIADGVVGMDGNGPLHGRPRALGCLVFGNDPVAVDATCCRLMEIEPMRVKHLAMATPLGNVAEGRIEQLGETVTNLAQPFELIPSFAGLRA